MDLVPLQLLIFPSAKFLSLCQSYLSFLALYITVHIPLVKPVPVSVWSLLCCCRFFSCPYTAVPACIYTCVSVSVFAVPVLYYFPVPDCTSLYQFSTCFGSCFNGTSLYFFLCLYQYQLVSLPDSVPVFVLPLSDLSVFLFQ